jgi:hypothetical protein
MTSVSVCVAYNGTLSDEWELAKVWKEVVVFSSRHSPGRNHEYWDG